MKGLRLWSFIFEKNIIKYVEIVNNIKCIDYVNHKVIKVRKEN